MDLYAIHKAYMDMQSEYGGPSSPDARDSMARLHENILLRLFKGSLANRNSKPFDSPYDAEPDFQVPILAQRPKNNSVDFNAYPQMTRPPNGNARDLFGQPRVTLADQFTWGAVVCAGVFIVVFVCVMAAWWVHKKQQDRVRRRIAQSEAAQRPYCIENDPRGNVMDIQRPPSYFEVIGFFDPPPSYNDILRVNSSGQLQNLGCQAYDNVAVTIDELPPPFVEEAKSESKLPTDAAEASAIETVPATVITVRDELAANNGQS